MGLSETALLPWKCVIAETVTNEPLCREALSYIMEATLIVFLNPPPYRAPLLGFGGIIQPTCEPDLRPTTEQDHKFVSNKKLSFSGL